MKSLRNIKLRTHCSTPVDLFLGRHKNPLKEQLPVEPSHKLTLQCLQEFKAPLNGHLQQKRFVKPVRLRTLLTLG